MAAALADAGARALSWREQDIQMMMLAADVHLGTKNCEFQMERYVYKRRTDGIYLNNLGKTWEKLQLPTRVIVAIENPQGIIVQSARPYGWRAVLKFAQYTAAHVIDVTTTNNDVTTANKHQRVYQPQKPSPEQPRRRMGPRRYPRRRL